MGGRLTSGMDDVVPDTIVPSTGNTMLCSASCPRPSPPPPSAEEGSGTGGINQSSISGPSHRSG
eukprot:15440438-Alexandrium_andersonii.AAC.1